MFITESDIEYIENTIKLKELTEIDYKIYINKETGLYYLLQVHPMFIKFIEYTSLNFAKKCRMFLTKFEYTI